MIVSSAHAEEGCPAGFFPQAGDGKCTAVSEYNRLPLDDSKPMTFQGQQMSMAIVWLQATGVITKDTPKEFARFLHTYDAKLTRNIYLHSSGGDLMAGLELGQMIREAGMNTFIGRSISLDGVMNVYSYKKSFCVSACAYAFLGGVTRSYGEDDIYGIHRFGRSAGSVSGDDAQIISSVVAKYIERMGVDLSVFVLASTSSFEDELFRVPVGLGKRMRIIYDPSGNTSFVIEQRGGSVVAAFRLNERERELEGVIACDNGQRTLMLFDKSNSISTGLRAARQFPTEFKAQGRSIWGTATYLPADPARNMPIGVMLFVLPSLDEQAFTGDGIRLNMIQNPTLPTDLGARLLWVDEVSKYAFRMRAANAGRTLPIVFRDCRGHR